MAKKYYVVWHGRETGVFTDWASCQRQVNKFAGAKFKSFPTREEAEAAFRSGRAVAPSGKSAGSAEISTGKPSAARTIKTHTAEEIAAMPMDTKVFTDGGCEPNPGQAGSGVAVYRDDAVSELWYGLFNPNGTNNTAELNALRQALIIAKDELARDKSVVIFCDSKYSIQSITQWAAGWKKKGWTRKGGELKNLELIKETFALYEPLAAKVPVLHVNGHVGVEGNELADRMSILAIEQRNTSFDKYRKKLDLAAILAMRTG